MLVAGHDDVRCRLEGRFEHAVIGRICGDDLDSFGWLYDPLRPEQASVVAAAERLRIEAVATLDRRHFSVVRPRHVPAFKILP